MAEGGTVAALLFLAIAGVGLVVAGFLISRLVGGGAPPGAPATAPSPDAASDVGLDVQLREIVDGVRLPAVFLDRDGRVAYCNRFLLDLLGGDAALVMAQDWFDAFVPNDQRSRVRRAFLDKIGPTAPATSQDQHEIVMASGVRRLIAWENVVLRASDGTVRGVAAIGVDVTERTRVEEQLRHGAMYDALTGLPNRNLFMDRIASCVARAKRRPQYRFAALFLDLDRFKVVNDGLGHQAGDHLLVDVGQRLSKCLRPGDSVARLGGDQFAVLVDDVADEQVPSLVADRIQTSLAVPFDLDGRQVFLTASIGIALNKPRYEGPDDFMRDADTAMHHAKAQGKARHEIFETGMHTRAKVLLNLEHDLHRAIEREQLGVHYQPIAAVKTGRVCGFEALARWERTPGNFVPPLEFIRIAEETGLIVPLGAWVLRQACRQLNQFQREQSPSDPLMMSVNLSAKQFAQPDLVHQVARIVQEAGIEPGSLKLEVTESILMHEPESAAAMLSELRAQNVSVCIDDFGTGYSSLSYLLRFPAQTLKIDRSFVTDMSVGSQHSEMVRMIMALARNLGMDVIAEGVETEDQMAQLKAMSCDFVQGYLISRPVDADGARALLHPAPVEKPPRRKKAAARRY